MLNIGDWSFVDIDCLDRGIVMHSNYLFYSFSYLQIMVIRSLDACDWQSPYSIDFDVLTVYIYKCSISNIEHSFLLNIAYFNLLYELWHNIWSQDIWLKKLYWFGTLSCDCWVDLFTCKFSLWLHCLYIHVWISDGNFLFSWFDFLMLLCVVMVKLFQCLFVNW